MHTFDAVCMPQHPRTLCLDDIRTRINVTGDVHVPTTVTIIVNVL